MNKADEVFGKIMKLSLKDMLLLCANAIDSDMDKKRLSTLLLILETQLQKERMIEQLGLGEKP